MKTSLQFIAREMNQCTLEQFAALIAAEMREGWRCVGQLRIVNGCWFQEFTKSTLQESEEAFAA